MVATATTNEAGTDDQGKHPNNRTKAQDSPKEGKSADIGPDAYKKMYGRRGTGSTLEERKPSNRQLRFSSRDNSAFKWKEDKSVVGALEVPSEPVLNLRGKLRERKVLTLEAEFEECLKIWNERKLRRSFVEASENVPPATGCCGLFTDGDGTIRKLQHELNSGWVPKVNAEIKSTGYKLSCFVWSWNNPAGKAETLVLLIRFHSLHKNRR